MAYLDVRFFANTLGVSTSMQVLLPQGAGPGQIGQAEGGGEGPYPVLYLLHGWSDDDSIWMRRTSIERYAMERGLAVVMPRGELSYYQNMASGMAFYDFIAEEVPRLCESWFPIRKDRAGTFAAGLSMGGYGAFLLGLSRPDRYVYINIISAFVIMSTSSGCHWSTWKDRGITVGPIGTGKFNPFSIGCLNRCLQVAAIRGHEP